MVRTIAARHGLGVKTDMNASKLFEQHHESDMAFLNRLAKEYNAIFNIKNNTLYMMKKAVDVPNVSIAINQCISSEINHEAKTFYQSCKAIFHDTKKTSKIVGKGEPVLVIQGKWLTNALAKEAAKYALERANQGTSDGTASFKGRVIFAGSQLNMENEAYEITKVNHNIERTWTTDIAFKKSTA